jgi:hypothetical protein
LPHSATSAPGKPGGFEKRDHPLGGDPASRLVESRRLIAQGAHGPGPNRGLARFAEHIDDRHGHPVVGCELVAYEMGKGHRFLYRQFRAKK